MFDMFGLYWAGKPINYANVIIIIIMIMIIVLVRKNTHLRIGHRLAEKTITVIGLY